jgi:hypothetical protein
MTTEPGLLEKNHDDLKIDKLPIEIQNTLNIIKTNLQEEEEERRLKEEQDSKNPELTPQPVEDGPDKAPSSTKSEEEVSLKSTEISED